MLGHCGAIAASARASRRTPEMQRTTALELAASIEAGKTFDTADWHNTGFQAPSVFEAI